MGSIRNRIRLPLSTQNYFLYYCKNNNTIWWSFMWENSHIGYLLPNIQLISFITFFLISVHTKLFLSFSCHIKGQKQHFKEWRSVVYTKKDKLSIKQRQKDKLTKKQISKQTHRTKKAQNNRKAKKNIQTYENTGP